MKYIMLQTEKGQHLPFIFPDNLTHYHMNEAVTLVVGSLLKSKCLCTSAGTVNLGLDVTVEGGSESLGGLLSKPMDAARIMFGESIAFMPDELAVKVLEKLKETHGG